MLALFVRLQLALSDGLTREEGQTSAEYALVVLGVAAIALLILAWAGQTNRVSDLLDALFDHVKSQIT